MEVVIKHKPKVSFPLLIFDLDGVLIDSKELHYHALNRALQSIDSKYKISLEEHLKVYDGLTTREKLKKLNIEKGLSTQHFEKIWKLKQKYTKKSLATLNKDYELISIFRKLNQLNVRIALASNSIKDTVHKIINGLGISKYFDLILTNSDITSPKPHPEIYWKCMTYFGVLPSQTVIFEDSPIGKESAVLSGANIVSISNRNELQFKIIKESIDMCKKKDKVLVPWHSNKLNVLIPMAGAGSRFERAGYTFPKPLVEVENKPMIQAIVENLNIVANYIFIVQKEHFHKFNLGYLLNLIAPNCKIVQVDGLTEGAACTTLLAKDLINNSNPLLIANSDQIVNWSSSEILYSFGKDELDGGILTFESTHPKWSYVKLDKNNYVIEVAEKKPISNVATVGIYYWRRGSDYVKYAEQMIKNQVRTNGEFYVAPVFNEAIKDNKKFIVRKVKKMWGIGTPEDLNNYLNRLT